MKTLEKPCAQQDYFSQILDIKNRPEVVIWLVVGLVGTGRSFLMSGLLFFTAVNEPTQTPPTTSKREGHKYTHSHI